MALGFLVDTRLCQGCKTCSTACALSHRLPTGVWLRRVRSLVDEDAPAQAFVSLGCSHCDDPACLPACPVRAYRVDETTGLVVQNHALCIGCGACVDACPFHAPFYHVGDATTYKCDGCVTRVAAGESPACVTACPAGAIAFGELADLMVTRPGCASLKDLVETSPNILIIPEAPASPAQVADVDASAFLVDAGCAM